MAKLTKRMRVIREKVDATKQYDINEAIALLKELATAKFVESVDVAVNLGIDARKSDQNVRGATVLPHGTGRSVRVAVFAQGANAEAAKAAGAELVGKAVEGALIAKFRNAGQTCVCANRLYVQNGVYDRFAEKLQQAVSKLHIGNGLEKGVTIGPLIDEKAVAKVEEHIADALEKGARVVCGGKAHERGGNFFQPTILVDVPANAKVSKEETFGPLAPLFRFKDEADVIAQANDTEFGLAAYFYARDLSRVFRVGEALEYGIIGINTGIISNEVAPFGGIKASGLGREGSKYGIEDYLEIKYMCIGL